MCWINHANLVLDVSSEQAREVLAQIKALEAQGFTFESAEGFGERDAAAACSRIIRRLSS